MKSTAIALAMMLAAPAIGVAGANLLAAQDVSLELRGGAAIGNYSESGAGLEWEPGPSFAAEAQLEVRPRLAVYAGFARSSFGCEEGFCTDRDATFTAQGITAGARWTSGLPWVRAGLAWQALELDATGGGGSGDMALGFDLGAGVDFSLGRGVRARPGISYRRVGSSLDDEDGHFTLLTLELGAAVRILSPDPTAR